ncbi:MAG: energy-coupling factor transporter ATPase [Clostridiales bacterium]|nr:energy-coupling factor transporter ATPase [Clostridiales bacterium]
MSIKVENLTHIYAEGLPHQQVAIEDISFEIEDGSFVGIIGHTGSGKSTLVQHLPGLLKPNSGSIIIDGEDITKKEGSLTEIRRKTGLVFQYPEYQLFEETVAKDVAFGPLNLGVSMEEAERRVGEALKQVGMDVKLVGDVSPFELSGGEKRRVAIAGVMAMEPEVLILDEPTAGLDPKGHHDILELVEKIHKAKGGITILVSHNMADIVNYADKVLVIEKGKLVMEGTPLEIFKREDELIKMDLDIPPAAELIRTLRERGLKIKGNPMSVKEAVSAIYEAIKP